MAGEEAGGGGASLAKEGGKVLEAIMKAEAERRKQKRKQLFEGSQTGLATIARSGELLSTGQLGALSQIMGNVRSSQRR